MAPQRGGTVPTAPFCHVMHVHVARMHVHACAGCVEPIWLCPQSWEACACQLCPECEGLEGWGLCACVHMHAWHGLQMHSLQPTHHYSQHQRQPHLAQSSCGAAT